jgi:hypothetical protein
MQRPPIEDIWPRIWCPTCEAICPLVTAPLPDPADHDACDLLCGICSFVVATLSRTRPDVAERSVPAATPDLADCRAVAVLTS